MPIDLAKAAGAELPALTYEYKSKELILYALGVGAGADPDDLKFCYENPPGLSVLPTFGVVPPFPALMALLSTPGVEINPMMILHGEQYIEIRKQPAPTGGKLTCKPRISNIYDKGKGALIEIEVETFDESGEVVHYNVFGTFIRGEGGFGVRPQRSQPNAPSRVRALEVGRRGR